MKILQVHNFYQQAGGEDQVVSAEHALLTGHGHAVEQFLAWNHDIAGLAAGVKAALHSIWNQEMYSAAKSRMREFRPDVMHVHNTHAEISPAVYYAAASLGVPVVQTLHNYRLVCSAATLFRDGAICEKCVGLRVPIYAPLHRCYRGSSAASLAVSASAGLHRIAGTWSSKIQCYFATTDFAKAKFVSGGLPASKITVKPNFLARDPGPGRGSGGYVLFAGRFCAEKGLDTLLQAASQLPHVTWKLAGVGPLLREVEAAAASLNNVELLGQRTHEEIICLMQNAELLIFPSLAFESLPMVLVEAFACGTPIICSDLPSLQGVIAQEMSGMYFETGNATALAASVHKALSHADMLLRMRIQARATYESAYTAEVNYRLLMGTYEALHKGKAFPTTEKVGVKARAPVTD